MRVRVGTRWQLDPHRSQLAGAILQRDVPKRRVAASAPNGQIQQCLARTFEFRFEVLTQVRSPRYILGLSGRGSEHSEAEADHSGCEQGSEISSVTGHR